MYYYRKKRVNGKVISLYCGKGEQGREAYEQDLRARLQRLAANKAFALKVKQDKQIIADLHRIEKSVSTLTQATLIVSGFTAHKGQWRKKRNVKQEK